MEIIGAHGLCPRMRCSSRAVPLCGLKSASKQPANPSGEPLRPPKTVQTKLFRGFEGWHSRESARLTPTFRTLRYFLPAGCDCKPKICNCLFVATYTLPFAITGA
jgi:hypothetical protein